ncbi:uncharacterized protein I206_107302 [Kwoniella pini CBS 10737]|uniref:DUF1996 domain-containing protein n=1 Tax=Kwoniella pini CBS 10737 TaxID=1296096 RepID=A0AAJ8LBX9_9TREE
MSRVNTQGEEKIYEFPKGMKMTAGNPFRNTIDENDPAQAAIEYVCLGTDVTPMNAFPERSCPDDLRAQITFPNCWDGKNVWLEGSKHISYPAEGRFDAGGACPSTHPYRIPTLFFEYHFNDKYGYTPGARVWAQGDDIGYGFHGDFTNGWPEGLFTEIVNAGSSCEVLFEVGNCPPLKQYFSGIGGGTCQPDDPTVIVNEEIGDNSAISRLPGNNPIWNGGSAPNKSGSGGAASASASAPASAGGSTISSNGSGSTGQPSAAAIQPPSSSLAPQPVEDSLTSSPAPFYIPPTSTAAVEPPATTSQSGRWGGWGAKRRIDQ